MFSDGTSRFLYDSGIDQLLHLDNSTGSMSYLQDHLGSTSQLVDTLNASRKARYDYKSYGKLEGDGNNPLAANPFTYTGREDDGTGLMYYRARYYDPELEVFISQDPLGDAQRYVGGNPLIYNDPLGLDPNLNLIPHGSNASTGDNMIYNIAQNQINKTSDWWGLAGALGQPYTVVSHGSETTANHMSPLQLANRIRKDPNFNPNQPGPIMLYGCNTGKGSFAQQLANFLGVPVVAPTTQVFWGNGNVMGPYHALPGNDKRPDYNHPGEFKRFEPQN